jgi:superfamily II DNA or RNA helicase
MKIEQIDPVYCKVMPKEDIHLIKKCLEYSSVYWKSGAYRKEKLTTTRYRCDLRKGIFLAGLLPRVLEYCSNNNISEVILGAKEGIQHAKVSLPGITLRQDQNKLVDAVNEAWRGLIVAPPGIGKTVMAGAIISQYPDSVSIMVVHTKALFTQTIKEFQRWFGDDVGWFGDTKTRPGRVNVLMAQTANWMTAPHSYNVELVNILAEADVLIVDEAHHCGNIKGHYSRIFELCRAIVRVGFTATPNEAQERKLVCEGYLGPVIGELPMGEGIAQGLLARPELKLVPVPLNTTIGEVKTYKDIRVKNKYGVMEARPGLYTSGIVMNRTRNRLVVKEAAEQVNAGKSVLIMILDVKNGQGQMLQDMARTIYDLEFEFIQGDTKSKIRERIKETLQSKKTKCVIATTIWREGINIPSLDCIINACGGKSEITTLQAIGRGLRTAEGKEKILIIDFLDPYRYLAQHTVMRLQTYVESGCL